MFLESAVKILISQRVFLFPLYMRSFGTYVTNDKLPKIEMEVYIDKNYPIIQRYTNTLYRHVMQCIKTEAYYLLSLKSFFPVTR
jgi:hypothetical protein